MFLIIIQNLWQYIFSYNIYIREFADNHLVSIKKITLVSLDKLSPPLVTNKLIQDSSISDNMNPDISLLSVLISPLNPVKEDQMRLMPKKLLRIQRWLGS